MKKFLSLLIALPLVACTPAQVPDPTPTPDPGKEDPKPGKEEPTTTTYSLSLNPSTLVFPAEGGSWTVQLTTEADWKGYCQEDWVSFVHSSGQGDDEIIVTVAPNTDTEYGRRATIDFEAQGNNVKGSAKLEISQEKADVPPDEILNTKVYTGAASAVTSTSANITGNYTGAPEGGVYDRGVYYGTSENALNLNAGLNSSTSTEAYFTVKLGSLEPSTTYYYQVYVTVWSEARSTYVDVTGEVKSFTTQSGGTQVTGLQYLGGYDIPAIDLRRSDACSNYGKETFGSTNWYNYLTDNVDQMVVTHTYRYDGKQYRNWTGLIDKDKQGPLWIAFPMHDDAYPHNGVGRGSWNPDPGIPESWQRSIASSTHSRGHFCASNYRQANYDARDETFYYTNQALQWQDGFNSGIWSALETAVVDNAPTGRDTLYVVVGVLYENPNNYQIPNGGKDKDKVLVPSHFYKCLMKCSFGTDGKMTAAKGCAYFFENKAYSNSNYASYITSIDAIEQRSGWDFFTNVPASLQNSAEAQSSPVW